MKERPRCDAPLVLIGGATTPEGAALGAFVTLTRGREGGRVVVLTTASGRPFAAARHWRRELERAGCTHLDVPIVRSRETAELARVVALIDRADGVFLGGGDQVKLVSVIGGTATAHAIRRAHERGAVIGGTSAGAAALAMTTLAGNETDERGQLVEQYIGPGLGLLRHMAIIDTHFSQRRRLYRLFVALSEHHQLMGLGVDENTALIVRGDVGEVVGDGGVTFVDGRGVQYANVGAQRDGRPLTIADVRVGVVGAGHRFDLERRTLLVD